jgi:chaperonin GroES
MKIKPLGDRILVKRDEKRDEMRGGIVIPDSAKEKSQEALVIAVGAGRRDDSGKRIPMDVKKGDRILLGKYSGTEVNVDDQEYVILQEQDVLAVLKA